MVNFSNWSNSCKSLLAGQDCLFDEIISNFIEKRSKFKGFHGIVLEGATGSGKSTFCHVLRETCPFEVVFKDCVEIFINSKIGGSERELENIFTSNPSDSPLLIILDHAESLLGESNSKDENSEFFGFSSEPMALERKLFLLAKFLMDKIELEEHRPVFLIAIVPEKSVLPAEIRFPGRLNHFFNLNISKSRQREALLKKFLSSWPFESEESRSECIKILSGQPTSGFTPADLENLLQRTWEIKSGPTVSFDDFMKARHIVNPSSIVARLTKSSPSKIELIGLEKEMNTIQQYMSAIFRNDRSVPLPRGILLEGPSGCGKSVLASKLSEISFKLDDSPGKTTIKFPVNFISIDSTQIISKYFGQSDRNLAQIFNEARQAAPCILFFDQIDTLVGKRSSSGSGSEDRLVTTFLVEMDGLKSKLDLLEENRTVIVLGTTSKNYLIDPAILRPGRLDLHVNIPLPNRENRLKFIHKFTSTGKYNLSESEIEAVLNETDGFSYAELDSIFKEAAMTALRNDIDCLSVEFKHFKL